MHLEGDHEFVDFCLDGFLIEKNGGYGLGVHGLDVLILLIEGDDLGHRMWLEAVQPVEEVHKRMQGSLLQQRP